MLIRIERGALIFHRYPKWDIAIWGALLRTATLYLYTMRWPYSECCALYSQVSYSDCLTPYSRVSYSECSTPYNCALLRIDTNGARLRIKILLRLVQDALKPQVLLFCTITHAGLCKFLNNHSYLKVVLVEAHIVDRLHPRILLLIMKIQVV